MTGSLPFVKLCLFIPCKANGAGDLDRARGYDLCYTCVWLVRVVSCWVTALEGKLAYRIICSTYVYVTNCVLRTAAVGVASKY